MTTRAYAVSRTIGAPAPVVWGLLTDPAGYRDWNPAVVSIDPLSPLVARRIPDLTPSFDQFADGLQQAAERAAG